MNQQIKNSSDTDHAHSAKTGLSADAKMEALQQRVTTLEETLSAYRASRLRIPQLNSRIMVVGVLVATMATIWIVFGLSSVVHSQSSASDPLTIDKNGNVGIGTSTPANKLSVAGNADFSGNLSVTGSVGAGTIASTNKLSVAGNADFAGQAYFSGNVGIGTTGPTSRLSIIDAGNTVAGQQIRIGSTAGASDYTMGRNPTTGFLDFSGSQTGFVGYTFSNGNVGIGTTTPRAKLDVAGTIISQGRYQRDDSAETTYEISPRYHVSLTQNVYDGSTRQIPQQVIVDLCADYDGCQFRLGMTRYAAGTGTEVASITGIMYYSTIDNRWRSSSVPQGKEVKPLEASGIDGNKRTEHVADAWATCFLTDSPYSRYQDQSDPTIGMYLLLWNGYPNPGRTCELTLID